MPTGVLQLLSNERAHPVAVTNHLICFKWAGQWYICNSEALVARGRQPYVCCRSLLVLGHTALQIKCEVVAVHQNTLAKLLLKLLHIWLYSWEVKFLQTAHLKVMDFISECIPKKWTSLCAMSNYLRVWVQGEQLQSRLILQPWLYVSCALKMEKGTF